MAGKESAMYTERQALKEYVSFLKEERVRISSEYWQALERLKQLDEKLNAQHEPSELVVKMLEVIEKQNDTIDQLKLLIPSVSIEQAIQNIKHVEVVEAVQEVAVSTQHIEQQKEADEKKSIMKRKKKSDMRSLAYELANFLKNKGTPVKMAHIVEHMRTLNNFRVPKNPTNTMNQIITYEPKIERIGKGYYQYRI